MFSAPFSCIIMANVKMDDTVLFNFCWRPQKVKTMLMHLFFFFLAGGGGGGGIKTRCIVGNIWAV